MSYRSVFFAVPYEEASEEQLLKKLVKAAFTSEQWNTIEKFPPVYAKGKKPAGSLTHAYVAMSSDAEAAKSGLRYFALGLNGTSCGYWYKFQYPHFVEALAPLTVVMLCHDDQTATAMFERRAEKPKLCWLLTSGPYYGGSMDRFTVDFVQRAYSNAQLAELSEKDEAAMTPAEYRAVAEYDDAIKIGLRQFYPKAKYAEYLRLLSAKQVWMFNRKDRPKLVAKPKAFRVCIDDVPNAAHFRRANLPRD